MQLQVLVKCNCKNIYFLFKHTHTHMCLDTHAHTHMHMQMLARTHTHTLWNWYCLGMRRWLWPARCFFGKLHKNWMLQNVCMCQYGCQCVCTAVCVHVFGWSATRCGKKKKKGPASWSHWVFRAFEVVLFVLFSLKSQRSNVGISKRANPKLTPGKLLSALTGRISLSRTDPLARLDFPLLGPSWLPPTPLQRCSSCSCQQCKDNFYCQQHERVVRLMSYLHFFLICY